MLVAVLGNYNSTNLGDDMYLSILRSTYKQHEFVSQFELGARWPDLLIYGGGGVLREDEGRHRLLMMWVKKYNAPYCVLSVGSARGENLRFSNEPFPGAEFVTVRDGASASAIEGAEMLPDLAWLHEPIHDFDDSEGMGIMVRHSKRYNSFEVVLRTRMEMDLDGGPFVFMHTYGPLLSGHAMAHPIRAGYDSTFSHYSGKDPAAYLGIYRSVDRVLAMTYHGIIFSAIYGKKWATWPYETKVDWLIRDLDGEASDIKRYGLIWNATPPDTVCRMRETAGGHIKLLDRYLK